MAVQNATRKCKQCLKTLSESDFFRTVQGKMWSKCKACIRIYRERVRIEREGRNDTLVTTQTRQCKVCQRTLPLFLFYKHPWCVGGRVRRCRDCVSSLKKKKYREKPDWKLQKYQLSLADYEAMKSSQNNRCGICGRLPNPGRSLHVDHDHKTGQIRGLLCGSCNRGLGLFRESTTAMRKAIRYLKSQKCIARTGNTSPAFLWDLT